MNDLEDEKRHFHDDYEKLLKENQQLDAKVKSMQQDLGFIQSQANHHITTLESQLHDAVQDNRIKLLEEDVREKELLIDEQDAK